MIYDYGICTALVQSSCQHPQFQHSRMLFTSFIGHYPWSFSDLMALTMTLDPSSTTFICDIMLSAAWQISSVFFSVRSDSRSNLSLALASWMLNTSRSQSIWSVVIVANSHPLPSFLSAMQYWSYVSPASWTRRLKWYCSNETVFRGWQYSLNLANTGSILELSPSAAQPVNVENTCASSPTCITVNNVATWIASDFLLSSTAKE